MFGSYANASFSCFPVYGLCAAFLWQLMRFNMLQLVKKLRTRFQGREMSDADILNWANRKVRSMGRKSRIESFKVGDRFCLPLSMSACILSLLILCLDLVCLVFDGFV